MEFSNRKWWTLSQNSPEEIDTTIFTFPKTSNISLIELRELHILPLCQKFSNTFSNTDIVTISALTIGGIYYLILHDKLSTFSRIDLKKESDRHLIHAKIKLYKAQSRVDVWNILYPCHILVWIFPLFWFPDLIWGRIPKDNKKAN